MSEEETKQEDTSEDQEEQSQTTYKCGNCGDNISSGVSYCPSCGEKLDTSVF